MTATPTVFIVDDDPLVSSSLDRLVRSVGYQAAVFGSSSEFLFHDKNDSPGCLVLDVQLPDLCGLSLQQALAARGPGLPIIFLTGHGDIPMSVRAIKAGAVDFLTKPCEDQNLIEAIEQAIVLDKEARQVQAERTKLLHCLATLTKREREVCSHVIAGRLNKQIAADLGTCEQTIKVHRMRIMEKLRVRSLAQLIKLAERGGISPAIPQK
ncbi:response regulator transcription factor [Candidatus Methylospira mobilis]|uniref:Response regulator transcription factor n=1 Tax=Candidatus Methylospira mobilis TaxID=1808979 RepID=A0A5Q0BMN0_9GAMM|nr:response regulator transcription factor [Candidatus Methylospira mobilis]QFY43474.1 response regulator transcription factor [Candidatus Methylospira mobilis]WNV03984.1 response regulator transcription factor [Candidatus Methylospira mobilis]